MVSECHASILDLLDLGFNPNDKGNCGSSAKPDDSETETQPGDKIPPSPGHGRNGVGAFGGARKVDQADGAGSDRGTSAAGGHRSLNGAVALSLIHTCQLCGANSFDYKGPGIRKSGKAFGQGQKAAKTVRVGLYARVSTLDQQTLRMQNRAMREYAARRGWNIALQVKEVGSGATRRRLREKLQEAARRREIDVVLEWRLDRRGRSVADLLATLTELEHLGVGFVSLTEALDLTRPGGRAHRSHFRAPYPRGSAQEEIATASQLRNSAENAILFEFALSLLSSPANWRHLKLDSVFRIFCAPKTRKPDLSEVGSRIPVLAANLSASYHSK